MTAVLHLLAAASPVGLATCACVALLVTSASVFRLVTRTFDWGPRDT